jgi:hypothetical protein
MKLDIEIGKLYGYLQVISKIERKNKTISWLCLCTKCNRQCEKGAATLKTNKSCGCFRTQMTNTIHHKGHKDLRLVQFNHVKRMAKRRNIEFNLTIEYISELIESQNFKCCLSGLPIELHKGGQHKYTASLDRIDSKIGYLIGNVQWVHRDVNFMKQQLDQNKFLEYCRIITEYNRK